MPSSFPTSFDALTNPVADSPLASVTVPHASQHTNINDIIEAIEAKLGLGAGGAVANTVLRGTGPGNTGFGKVLTDDIADAQITSIKIGAGQVTYDKLPHVGAGNIIRSNGSANVAGKIQPGDIIASGTAYEVIATTTGAGGTAVYSKVLNAMIAANNVTTDKIWPGGAGAANTVLRTTDGTNSLFGKVTNADMGGGSVGNSQLGASSVTADKIVAGSVTTTQTIAGSTSDPSTGATSAGSAPGIAQMLLNVAVEVGDYVIAIFDTMFSHTTAGQASVFDLYWNAANIVRRQMTCPISNQQYQITIICPLYISAAGTYQFDARFWTTGGTVTCFATQRTLSAIRLRR